MKRNGMSLALLLEVTDFFLLVKSQKYFEEPTRNGKMKNGSDLYPAPEQIIILCLTLDMYPGKINTTCQLVLDLSSLF